MESKPRIWIKTSEHTPRHNGTNEVVGRYADNKYDPARLTYDNAHCVWKNMKGNTTVAPHEWSRIMEQDKFDKRGFATQLVLFEPEIEPWMSIEDNPPALDRWVVVKDNNGNEVIAKMLSVPSPSRIRHTLAIGITSIWFKCLNSDRDNVPLGSIPKEWRESTSLDWVMHGWDIPEKLSDGSFNQVKVERSTSKVPYYNQHPAGIECIDVVRHYNFNIGNAMKYLWRQGLKKEEGLDDKTKAIEDCKKAIYYIQDHINQLESR